MTYSYDEIQVYNGIAERTGTRFDRAAIRGRRGICRSVSELGSKSRRLGDGFYYIVSAAWPQDQTTVDLNRAWTTMG